MWPPIRRIWPTKTTAPGRITRIHLFVELSFNAVRDAEQRQALKDIGTNFDLTDDEVDLLITASEQVLRESPDFQTFLRRTNGQIKLP